MEGLICLKNAFKKLGTPLFVCKANSEQEAVEIAVKLSGDACEVITDAAYLREDRDFEESLNDKLLTMCRRFTRVEGNVLVPVAVNFILHFIFKETTFTLFLGLFTFLCFFVS